MATFLSIQPQHRTPRLRLWLFAWGLVFAHLCLALVPPLAGVPQKVLVTAQLATLAVAGLTFGISVTTLVFSDSTRIRIMIATGIPLVAYSALLAWGVDRRWIYILLSSWIAFGGAAWFLAWYRKVTRVRPGPCGILSHSRSDRMRFQLAQ